MTHKTMQFSAALLERASQSFSNYGCNDLDKRMLAAIGFTETEKGRLALEYSQWNEKRQDPQDLLGFDDIPDFAWMAFLSDKLRKSGDGE